MGVGIVLSEPDQQPLRGEEDEGLPLEAPVISLSSPYALPHSLPLLCNCSRGLSPPSQQPSQLGNRKNGQC